LGDKQVRHRSVLVGDRMGVGRLVLRISAPFWW
jgi:hypothetical protein